MGSQNRRAYSSLVDSGSRGCSVQTWLHPAHKNVSTPCVVLSERDHRTLVDPHFGHDGISRGRPWRGIRLARPEARSDVVHLGLQWAEALAQRCHEIPQLGYGRLSSTDAMFKFHGFTWRIPRSRSPLFDSRMPTRHGAKSYPERGVPVTIINLYPGSASRRIRPSPARLPQSLPVALPALLKK